jgi:molecular chaperone GrpE
MSDQDKTNPAPEQLPEGEETLEAPAPGAAASEQDQALAAARAEAAENWDRFVRAQAEMENLRKRAERDLENAHKFALERFATELLAVRDSLELGAQAAESETDPAKLREGTQLTLKLLEQVMQKFNIEVVDPLGQRFDPEKHQAMTMQETADADPNTVIAVMQKGYLINGRLLRPAMVVVAKAPQG